MANMKNKGKSCLDEACESAAWCKGYCRPHYRENYEYTTDKRRGQYRRDRTPNKAGYVHYYDPGSIHANSKGYVYEHRVVIGDYLGRRLYDHENVHHKNGDRSDNRLENLELWSTMQPSGQRVEDKVAFAKEILKLYGQESWS